MEEREISVKKEKYIILYQRSVVMGNYLAASVFPGNKEGLDLAIKAVNRRARAMLIVTSVLPDSYNLLQFCAQEELAGRTKLVQA